MNDTRQPAPTHPWLEWLPDGVAFLRDAAGRVRALAAHRANERTELALGAVLLRAKVHDSNPRCVEWRVYASDHRHALEAKTAIALIHASIHELQAFQDRVRREKAKRRLTRARVVQLTREHYAILGFVVAAFLLVDPLSHPELATLYHPKALALLKSLPDLQGRLNLPTDAA